MYWLYLALGVWLSLRVQLRAADPKLELIVQTGHADRILAVSLSGGDIARWRLLS
jgi:hypothetical protein